MTGNRRGFVLADVLVGEPVPTSPRQRWIPA